MRRRTKTGLAAHNFYYGGVNVEYSTYYECQNGSNCCDNDYCRCGVIQDEHIEKIDMGRVLSYYSQWDKEIDRYCIERIFSHFKVWSEDAWDIHVCGGYYGQELDGVFLREAEAIEQAVESCLLLETDSEKIEFVLNLEYGYLLDSVKDKEWEVKEVDKKLIRFVQKDHYRKLDREAVERYKEHDYPLGICLEDSGHYEVVDGYHRLSAGGDSVKIISSKK